MFVIYPRSVISVFYLLVIYPSILFVHIKYLVYDASKSYSPPPPPPTHTHRPNIYSIMLPKEYEVRNKAYYIFWDRTLRETGQTKLFSAWQSEAVTQKQNWDHIGFDTWPLHSNYSLIVIFS